MRALSVENNYQHNKLKLLICTTIFPNREEINKGIYIYKQVEALSRLAELKVISPIPYCPKWLKIKSYQTFNRIPFEDYLGRVPVVYPKYFITPKVGRILYGLFYALSIFKTFYQIKKDFKPNLVIGYWVYPDGFAVVLLAKLFRLPVIVAGRGCDVNDAGNNLFRKLLVKWTLQSSDGVMAVSQAMKKIMVSLNVAGEKVTVIPNGVDSEFHRIEKEDAMNKLQLNKGRVKGKIILFCGRLSNEKGIKYLLEAVSILKMRKVEFTLLVLGNGPLLSEIKKIININDLSDDVRLYDEVPSNQVKYYMNVSDVLCLPSVREGWPNVVMEALACGLPVVASNVGGVPEIIVSDELGLIVEPGSSIELANALSMAIERKWDKEKISLSIKGKTWDRVANHISKLAFNVVSE